MNGWNDSTPAGSSAAAPELLVVIREYLGQDISRQTAPADSLTECHLGTAQWHADDRAQAVRSWKRGCAFAPSRWPLLRCLPVAAQDSGQVPRAADLHTEAFDDLCGERLDEDSSSAAPVSLSQGHGAVDRERFCQLVDRQLLS
ncbi:hypothetical protein [Streptomyces sp. NPDC001880]